MPPPAPESASFRQRVLQPKASNLTLATSNSVQTPSQLPLSTTRYSVEYILYCIVHSISSEISAQAHFFNDPVEREEREEPQSGMRERKMRERKMTPDSETFFGSSYPGLAEPCSTSWRPRSPTIHTSPFRFARHHAPFTLPRPAPTAPTRAVQGERATRSGLDGVLPSSALASVATSGVPWFHSRPNDPSLRRTIPISTPLGLAVHGAKPSQSAP